MYIVVFWYFRYKYLVYTRYLNFWYIPKIPRPIPTLNEVFQFCELLLYFESCKKVDDGKLRGMCRFLLPSIPRMMDIF